MSKRPGHNAKEVREEAAHLLLPRVIEWMSRDGDVQDDPEEIIDQLADALEDDDGYEIAKNLDNAGWFDVDANLVEILDSAGHFKSEARNTLVKKWAIENEISAAIPIGTHVKTPRGDGVVSGVRADTAEYIVQTPDRTWSGLGTGYVMAAEDCEATGLGK